MSPRVCRPIPDRSFEGPLGICQLPALLVDETGVVAGGRGELGIIEKRAVRGQRGREISGSLQSEGTAEFTRTAGFARRWLGQLCGRRWRWRFLSRLDRGRLRGLRRGCCGSDRLIPGCGWWAATRRHSSLIGNPRRGLALARAQSGPREDDHRHERQRQQRDPPVPSPPCLRALPHRREDRTGLRSHRVDLLSRRAGPAGASERIEQLAHGCCGRTAGTEMACAGGSAGPLK